MKLRWKRKALIYPAILIIAGVTLFFLVMPSTSQPQEVTLSQVITMSKDKQIAQIKVDEDTLLVTTVDGKEYRAFKEPNASIYDIKGLGLELDSVVLDVKRVPANEILFDLANIGFNTPFTIPQCVCFTPATYPFAGLYLHK